MMKCGTCGYIALKETPDKCPVCTSPKEVFAEFNEIKESDEGKEKHVPVIDINKTCGMIEGDCTDVHVKVGETQHPMDPDHFIAFIDLYVDKEWVSRIHLSPNLNPAALVHLKATSGNLTAIEFCTVHGYWISEKEI